MLQIQLLLYTLYFPLLSPTQWTVPLNNYKSSTPIEPIFCTEETRKRHHGFTRERLDFKVFIDHEQAEVPSLILTVHPSTLDKTRCFLNAYQQLVGQLTHKATAWKLNNSGVIGLARQRCSCISEQIFSNFKTELTRRIAVVVGRVCSF